MHEEKEPICCVSWTTEQGKEKEPVTRGEREAFEALKRSAKETLGIGIYTIYLCPKGYLRCNFFRNGKQFTINIHRLIMVLFLRKQIPKWDHVHHINGNKRDNRIQNLSIIDAREHAAMHMRGRVSTNKGNRFRLTKEQSQKSAKSRRGVPRPERRKLSPQDEESIRYRFSNGEKRSSLAKEFGVMHATITACICRQLKKI